MLKNETRESVILISLSELHPFQGYGSVPCGQPFHVRDDDPIMQQITATVKEHGVRLPGLVRPDKNGGYEIVAGHRRFRACQLAGLDSILLWASLPRASLLSCVSCHALGCADVAEDSAWDSQVFAGLVCSS